MSDWSPHPLNKCFSLPVVLPTLQFFKDTKTKSCAFSVPKTPDRWRLQMNQFLRASSLFRSVFDCGEKLSPWWTESPDLFHRKCSSVNTYTMIPENFLSIKNRCQGDFNCTIPHQRGKAMISGRRLHYLQCKVIYCCPYEFCSLI